MNAHPSYDPKMFCAWICLIVCTSLQLAARGTVWKDVYGAAFTNALKMRNEVTSLLKADLECSLSKLTNSRSACRDLLLFSVFYFDLDFFCNRISVLPCSQWSVWLDAIWEQQQWAKKIVLYYTYLVCCSYYTFLFCLLILFFFLLHAGLYIFASGNT